MVGTTFSDCSYFLFFDAYSFMTILWLLKLMFPVAACVGAMILQVSHSSATVVLTTCTGHSNDRWKNTVKED